MSEYGHNYANGKLMGQPCHIDGWGAGPFVIEAGGKSFRFEDSDRFGPNIVKRDGAPTANPWPPERSPFWLAWKCWQKQGRKLAEDGISCVYELVVPKPTTYYRINKRDCMIVEAGDEDGAYIEVPKPDKSR